MEGKVRGWRAWARLARQNRRATYNGSPLHIAHALPSTLFSLLPTFYDIILSFFARISERIWAFG